MECSHVVTVQPQRRLYQSRAPKPLDKLARLPWRILLSGTQFPESSDRTLLVEIDEIHNEIIRMDHFDFQLLLQMGSCKVGHVECDNRVCVRRNGCHDDVSILGIHGFEDLRFGQFSLDLGVRKCRVHGSDDTLDSFLGVALG